MTTSPVVHQDLDELTGRGEAVGVDGEQDQRLLDVGEVAQAYAVDLVTLEQWMKPSCSRVRPGVDVVWLPLSWARVQSAPVARWKIRIRNPAPFGEGTQGCESSSQNSRALGSSIPRRAL